MRSRKPFWMWFAVCALLLPATCAHALDVERELDLLMRAQYGSYSPAAKSWKAEVDDVEYELMVVGKEKVATPYGDRLYVFVESCLADENMRSHGSSSLLGAFILEERQGKVELVAANKAIERGTFGCAQGEVKLMQFGPDHYYGWLYKDGWTGQGYTMGFYSVLLPRGKGIAELADLNESLDNTSSATCGNSPRACEELEFELKVDTSRRDAKVYPLILSRTGKRGGREIHPTFWHIDFDEKKWRYTVPKEARERY